MVYYMAGSHPVAPCVLVEVGRASRLSILWRRDRRRGVGESLFDCRRLGERRRLRLWCLPLLWFIGGGVELMLYQVNSMPEVSIDAPTYLVDVLKPAYVLVRRSIGK